jgi:hypothetical protein
VRLLNLTEGTVVYRVDERIIASLEPTSFESPIAGSKVRIGVGERTLSAEDSAGRSIGRVTATIRAGHEHLYAPGEAEQCFFLERRLYGADSEGTARAKLVGRGRFWLIDETIDVWFSPLPDAPVRDFRLSGGKLTAIRQRPCDADP